MVSHQWQAARSKAAYPPVRATIVAISASAGVIGWPEVEDLGPEPRALDLEDADPVAACEAYARRSSSTPISSTPT